MAEPPRRRTGGDPREAAEAAFRKATAPPPLSAERKIALPGVKEQVTLRIDREVLDFFQKDGPGWQDRIVEALREVAGVGGTAAGSRSTSSTPRTTNSRRRRDPSTDEDVIGVELRVAELGDQLHRCIPVAVLVVEQLALPEHEVVVPVIGATLSEVLRR